MNERAAEGISRRRLQLLAIYRGQCRGSGLGREGRELGQAVRQRSRRRWQKTAERDQGRAWRRCPASPTWRCSARSASRPSASTSTAPAPRATASRPATSTPRAGRDRRPGGRRPLRGRQRPQFPDGRAPGAAIPREPRGDPAHHRRRAESGGDGIVQVPLAEVADVRLVSGASFIYRENQERYIPIKFSVRGRDLGSAVLEAQQQIAEQVQAAGRLSPRMGRRVRRISRSAMERLAIVVPLSHRADPASALCQLRLADAIRCSRPASFRWP